MISINVYKSRSHSEWLHQACWKVGLSDGSTFYSKEGYDSWLDLHSWLRDNQDIYITNMSLQFRDNVIDVYSGRKDYILFYSVDAWYGTEISKHYYFLGYVKDDKAVLRKYMFPELVFVEEIVRDLDNPSVKMGLIRCKN